MSSPLDQDYFALFDLPVDFDVDPVVLRQRFAELQKAAHPDRYASGPGQAQRIAAQMAAHINEAFQTLRDPVARAKYLLSLRGQRWNDEAQTVSDPEFLMEQMELREELEEMVESSAALERLQAFSERLDAINAAALEELRAVLRGDDGEAARVAVQKLQFFARLRAEVEVAEESAN